MRKLFIQARIFVALEQDAKTALFQIFYKISKKKFEKLSTTIIMHPNTFYIFDDLETNLQDYWYFADIYRIMM